MSQLISALKKAQERRQESNSPSSVVNKIAFEEKKESNNKEGSSINIIFITIGISILLGGIITLVSFSIHKNESATMMSVIEKQDKQIKNLIVALNKNKSTLDNEIRKLNTKMDQNATEVKIKMVKLVINNDERYVKLKESAMNNQQDIKNLSKEIKSLKNKILEDESNVHINNGEVK